MQPHSSLIISVPEPKNLDKNVTREEYFEVYQAMIRKYKKRDRFGKELTEDPKELN